MATGFSGPLFLVGMPRSGTKLLRELLNGHPGCRIAPIETEFLPFWITHWKTLGDLSSWGAFRKFYASVMDYPYFLYMREEGKLIEATHWYHSCQDFSPQGVFEALLRHDLSIPLQSSIIWGDKSPAYVEYMGLIKKAFPHAKFIHIVRDVRDYCLSMSKAWGKNIYRAAQRWSDSLRKVRIDSLILQNDCLTIKYESLIENPKAVMSHVCHFCDLQFYDGMLKLHRPAENLGDTAGIMQVVSSNKNKFKNQMSDEAQRIIENIAGDMLRSYGYETYFEFSPGRMPKHKMLLWQVLDAVHLVKHEMAKRGLWHAIRFHARHYTISGRNL
jgi:LPS sulfotransferase NodH